MMDIRIFSGEDAGMGGSGQGRLRDGFLEQNAIARQSVDDWGLNFVVAVAMQMVRSHCVQRDEDHVHRLRLDSGSCNPRSRTLLRSRTGRWPGRGLTSREAQQSQRTGA